MKEKIEKIKILSNSLYVKFRSKIEDNFPNIWLRDHAKDEINWDFRSNQRKIAGCYLNKEDFDSVCKINGLY